MTLRFQPQIPDSLPPHVEGLVQYLGVCIDKWQGAMEPLSWLELLQGLEMMRFRITERIIREGLHAKTRKP